MLVTGKQIIIVQQSLVRVAELGNYAKSVDDLIDKVFPNFQENVVDSDWLSERGILAPLNEPVTKINSKLIDMMPASSKLYKSIDTAMSDDEATHYPPQPPRLINSTRCIVTKPLRNVIDVKIAARPFKIRLI